MKYFLKLNVVSIIYALMFWVPAEIMVNFYRIDRLAGWEPGKPSIATILFFITVTVEIIGGSFLLIYLSNKWLAGRMANFWTVILWLPYFVLFYIGFAYLFPITYGGDKPNPATGLILLGGLIAYPFYILVLNSIGLEKKEETV